MNNYDVIIVGSGASGIFAAYEIIRINPNINVLMIEKGHRLEKRKCPINGKDIKTCIHCKVCNIMNGYGGAGSLSDGKYNITNNFGGELYKYVGSEKSLELMNYVDEVLCKMGGSDAKLYSTANSNLKRKALQSDLHLLDAKVRHLGTDRNLSILGNIYDVLKDKLNMKFDCEVLDVKKNDNEFRVYTSNGDFIGKDLILATGRSGSKWISNVCKDLGIKTESNRVDIGVRVELPADIFSHITDEVYESKLVYRTKKYGDLVRTFCMNPYGEVVSENTNGIVTVNGHSYSSEDLHTENTNFALLVSNTFTEPFKDSNEYGESIAKLSNMLGGGVLVQRFGDLVKGRRTNEHRMSKSFTRPTLKATPGDLSLVIPKRQLDGIIEMIYALDKIAPGTANEDTLLYGVEVKFYNSNVEVDSNLETNVKGLYVLGDSSGVTHSLSQASASGVYVGRLLGDKYKYKN
ncbi:NAD(P)/FAD-dependent oxidoreductase [Clostridium niameyense]|uniref:NAD(P)/FAD-dependent oxidoreductase n=1 Tax=Clostridium niameyense TaxID=1622073 RepID=A0A6M0RDH8_9CLOT|nr:NAD(P)/FAD-dependent oxidoreductase [Clostridium niameyense]NEZ47887.1 NAD(P)/FAD-dependent oxidoreductase [Clostridium niameyense]